MTTANRFISVLRSFDFCAHVLWQTSAGEVVKRQEERDVLGKRQRADRVRVHSERHNAACW